MRWKKTVSLIAILAAALAMLGAGIGAASWDRLTVSAASGNWQIGSQINGFATVTAVTDKGKTVRFSGYKVSKNGDGSLHIDSGGWLLQQDATFGIERVDIDAVNADSGKAESVYVYGIFAESGTEHLDGPDGIRGEKIAYCRDGRISSTDKAGCSFIYLTNGRNEGYADCPLDVMSISFRFSGERVYVKELFMAVKDTYNEDRQIFAGEPYDEESMTDYYHTGTVFKGVQISAKLSNGRTAWTFPCFRAGDLKDGNGNVLDKSTARMYPGYTLEISADGCSFDIPFDCVIGESSFRPNNYSEMAPGTYPPAGKGWNMLIIPVCFTDDTGADRDDTMDLIKKGAGRVYDGRGGVTDFSPDGNGFMSASRYLDNASAGKFLLTSYISGWYTYPGTSEDAFSQNWKQEQIDAAVAQARKEYPGSDWDRFDLDGDGYLDAVCFISTLDVRGHGTYSRLSMAGAFDHTVLNLDHESPEGADNYISLSRGYFYSLDPGDSVYHLNNAGFLHELSHHFGIRDYYDDSSGYSSLGGFDMQDKNAGDWNPFSKYAVGWADPVTADQAAIDSCGGMFTLRSGALTGQCLVIPARGQVNDTPFSEYIMADFYTPDGNGLYRSGPYGMDGICGVRIWHVDARLMEKTYGEGTSDSWTRYDTFYTNRHNSEGLYMLELCPRDRIGKGAFTGYGGGTGEENTDSGCLYMVNDHFGQAALDTFLYQGLFDSGASFGWCVTVAEIGEDSEGRYAKIAITPLEDPEPRFDDTETTDGPRDTMDMRTLLTVSACVLAVLLAASVTALTVRRKKRSA